MQTLYKRGSAGNRMLAEQMEKNTMQTLYKEGFC